jgi:hypothetical protein
MDNISVVVPDIACSEGSAPTSGRIQGGAGCELDSNGTRASERSEGTLVQDRESATANTLSCQLLLRTGGVGAHVMLTGRLYAGART